MSSGNVTGSFWTTTDYGLNLLTMQQTELDTLLKNDSTTLEDILDCEELLQQCSNKNETLIDFLCGEKNLKKLLGYITRKPEENISKISEERRHRKNGDNESKETETMGSVGHPHKKSSLSSIPENNDSTATQSQAQEQKKRDDKSKEKKKKKKPNGNADPKFNALMWGLFQDHIPPPPPLPPSSTTTTTTTTSTSTSTSTSTQTTTSTDHKSSAQVQQKRDHVGNDSDDNDPELPDLNVLKGLCMCMCFFFFPPFPFYWKRVCTKGGSLLKTFYLF
ncbi:hypothetical protein RFI_01806 [Reticulomyxa filosa]|uniref:Uncharacterized protein n=1 Tax=Reticulomyxa filosa TaxID=46433 RepID=X6PAV3_RETFI|nr:hypothetical protein RFI_01806 [Reticulomyxa filosa]|eukprot:ETO35258.1 hypothetical protein RFI_01806 [Reticulomyxa filosa]